MHRYLLAINVCVCPVCVGQRLCRHGPFFEVSGPCVQGKTKRWTGHVRDTLLRRLAQPPPPAPNYFPGTPSVGTYLACPDPNPGRPTDLSAGICSGVPEIPPLKSPVSWLT